MTGNASILWRRLDLPGHDACWLAPSGTGWELQGTALFLSDVGPVALAYRVVCDSRWAAQAATIRGTMGDASVDLRLSRSPTGTWYLNDDDISLVFGCIDIDLGFTPATNTLALRRLSLPIGETAEFTSAWLDVERGRLEPLVQRYERRAQDEYWYEAKRFDYSARLVVAPSGFVVDYPRLWVMETRTGAG